MPDYLGPIPIPDPVVISPFPFRADYGASQEIPDRIIAHQMDPEIKAEQRFYLGDGARRFRVRKYRLDCQEYDDLKAHWQDAQGVFKEFDYQHPISHTEFQTFRVRYSDPTLTFNHMVDLATGDPGLTLIEVPQATPELACDKTLERFPDATFSAQLLDQVQRVVPLITITPRGPAMVGTVNSDGSGTVQWVSGRKFTVEMAGRDILLNGKPYTVSTYVSDVEITVDPAPPDVDGAAWAMQFPVATDEDYRLFLSDRRVYVTGSPYGDRMYLPRLLEWSGIAQSVGENSDNANFTFGNADSVWHEYIKQIDLTRATIEFWLHFSGSNVLLKLWRGYASRLRFSESEDLEVEATDGIYELNLAYPTRQISRTCWKQFADGVWCPYDEDHINPITGVPALDPGGQPFTSCGKSWENCVERGMIYHFGGQVCKAQEVSNIKPLPTNVFGYGRSVITSVTVRNDTIYQRPLQEVYTDTARPELAGDGTTVIAGPEGPAMQLNADIAGGIDEKEFFAAIGVVSEGPIGEYNEDLTKFLLNKETPHDPKKNGGIRRVLGNDPTPAPNFDFFTINHHPFFWPVKPEDATPALPAGTLYPPESTFAAGTAFVEIRSTDKKGLQLVAITEREMQVEVTKGMGGWIWTAAPDPGPPYVPGTREWKIPLTNPIWICINIYLRALGLKADPGHASSVTVEQMEALFDVQEAMTCADLCDDIVPRIIGEGEEIQFPFRGILKERKPLRDWIQEVLNTCLGYYTFNNGKLRLGMRYNSSVPVGGAFTIQNILHRSLQAEPVLGKFNYLTAEFGDEEFDWAGNKVILYDVENAKFYGTEINPRYTQSSMSLVGCSNKSQASRIVITRLREELGGTTRKEQMDARNVTLKTTVLALGIYPGQICSMDHPRLPNNRVEFRVIRWKLNPDWTVEISGSATCDSMYDYVFGPKPEDVLADPLRPPVWPMALGTAWLPNEVAPFPNDPVYAPTELTFALRQNYPIEAEGTYSPAVIVRGELTINKFLEGKPPAIRGIKWFPTGGELPGGNTYYFRVLQRDGTIAPDVNSPGGQYVQPSNFSAVWIPGPPTGTNTNRVVLSPIRTRQDMPGYSLWVGTDWRVMSQQTGNAGTPLPESIEVTGPLTVRTRGAPSPQAHGLRIKCREVWHSGVAGIQVMSVTAPNKIQSDELKVSDDNWVGQILTIISDASDGDVPLWNFTITAFDQALGEFTVSPDCTGIPLPGGGTDAVEEGDVMIIRSRPTSVSSTLGAGKPIDKLTNTLWQNDVGTAQFPQAADGLQPDTEIGLMVMIIAGTGRGQIREIIDNDNLSHTVKPPFTVAPDTTSIYIVTWPDWPYVGETIGLDTIAENQRIEIVARITNSVDQTMLVGGFLVDDYGNETFEEFACYREIYVYGEPYHVRTTTEAADDVSLFDHTIRVDTTDGDVTVNLLPVESYFGRKLLVVNDGTGGTPGQAIVKPFDDPIDGPEEFQTGDTEIVLASPGDWAEFVAAGDRLETAGTRRRNPRTWHRRKQLARQRRLLPSEAPDWHKRRMPMPPPDRKGQL